MHAWLGIGWPYGTLTVNVLGGFLAGFLMELGVRGAIPQELRLGLTAGFLGGFTTFSAFGYETVRLLGEGRPLAAGGNVVASVSLGVIFTFAGILAARQL